MVDEDAGADRGMKGRSSSAGEVVWNVSKGSAVPHIYLPLLYIDPTSGSLFIQAVIAALVVVPFFLRHQLRRAVAKVRGSSGAPASAPSAEDPPAPTGPAMTDREAASSNE